MADCMAFPKTSEEFIEQYKFTDTKQEYTNGAELIPVFRVKQMMEHYFAKDNNVPSKWIPVTERLPDLELSNAKANDMDLFPCLCFIPHKRAKNGWYITKLWYTGEGFIDGDNVYWDEATHWMPLPEPPKGE